MKRCNTCKKTLPECEFYLVRSDMHTLRSYCKGCAKKRQRARNKNTREDAGYVRLVRQTAGRNGNRVFAVTIPPAIFGALGKPSAVRWILRDGEVSMEVVL